MRSQLLETKGDQIYRVLTPNGVCEEALAYACGNDVALGNHMVNSFRRNCEFWIEDVSALWMMNLDNTMRPRVAEYLINENFDMTFVDLIMKLYNQLTEEECIRLGAPRAWDIFCTYQRDALGLLSYITSNENEDAEECAKVIFAFI